MRATPAASGRAQLRQRAKELGLGDQALGRDRGDLRVQRGRSPRRTRPWPRRWPASGSRSGPTGRPDRAGRSPPGAPPLPWTPGRPPRRSPGESRSGRRSARSRDGAPPGRRPRWPAGRPCDRDSTTAGTPPSSSKHSATKTQRRRPPLIRGEAHEAVAAPGEHRAEHLQAAGSASSRSPGARRRRDPGPVDAPLAALAGLGLGDEPARSCGPSRRSRPRGPPAAGAWPRSARRSLTRSATRSATWSVLFSRPGAAAGRPPARWRSTTRRTVLWVVPHSFAAAR